MKQENHTNIKELLYNTMAQEASGLYKQMITICTAFLGGSIIFFEKLFVSSVKWSIYILFAGWLALTYPLAVLMIIRWQNIESHRLMLEYLKSQDDVEDEAKFEKVVTISKKGRKWTMSAIISMIIGLIMIAVFTGINVGFLFLNKQQVKSEVIMDKNQKKETSPSKKSLDPSSLVQGPKRPIQSGQDNNSQTTEQSSGSNEKN